MDFDMHKRALALLLLHPGWSDRRLAHLLGVSNSTVSRWRAAEGLAPAVKQVGGQRLRRRIVQSQPW